MTKRTWAVTAMLSIVAALSAPAAAWTGAPDTVVERGGEVRPIVFPVDGDNRYTDTWLSPRGGGRRHVGVDFMADKLTPVVAAADGCITRLRYPGPDTAGDNYLILTDDDGWEYRYLHLNNDSPGTDDGANDRDQAFHGGLQKGDCVVAGQRIAYVGDSGNAEHAGAHLHFELRRPDGLWINPTPSVDAALRQSLCRPEPDGGGAEAGIERQDDDGSCLVPPPAPAPAPGLRCGEPTVPDPTPSPASARGAWVLADDGTVSGLDAPHLGDLATLGVMTEPVAIRATPSGEGYWIVDARGEVHPFGDAEARGDMSGFELNGPVLELAPEPDGTGYWLVADDGGVFAFDAPFLGSMGATPLNAPVISMAPTATGEGYFLVAADGGVFTFGDAPFLGSTGSMTLAAPVVSMAVHPDGSGYWLYAADGGVFSFGVDFHGSLPGLALCEEPTAVSLRVSGTGEGYWVLGDDGRTFGFGDARALPAAELDDGATAIDLAVRLGVDGPDDDPASP